jgi:hypothetical protein
VLLQNPHFEWQLQQHAWQRPQQQWQQLLLLVFSLPLLPPLPRPPLRAAAARQLLPGHAILAAAGASCVGSCPWVCLLLLLLLLLLLHYDTHDLQTQQLMHSLLGCCIYRTIC